MRIRPAQAVLNELGNGATMNDLAQQIHDGTAAVRQFGQKATVTLTLTLQPLDQKTMQLVQPPIIIFGEVTVKFPKAPKEATIFFVDDEGNPTRKLEREPELGLSLATAIGGNDNG